MSCLAAGHGDLIIEPEAKLRAAIEKRKQQLQRGTVSHVSKNGYHTRKIVESAIEFVDEEGFSALTIATLSKRLNIRPPSLYNHISGLHEIQAALAVKGLTMLCEAGKQVTAGLEKEDAVLAFARQYVQFVRQHPGLYEAAFSHMNEKKSVWLQSILLILSNPSCLVLV